MLGFDVVLVERVANLVIELASFAPVDELRVNPCDVVVAESVGVDDFAVELADTARSAS
ncbi:hypothetical protein [Mycobacterium avium]|uniref:hypothetical protein n=1 Tax=Mycobacterium avium TaxID=1764 RepID=UPI0015E1C9D1|nr:hypothetical protein [Mycobacterium avium]MDV3219603.1 hypothetical protein [Mycobacterium avium]